jgi:hypothetical protein
VRSLRQIFIKYRGIRLEVQADGLIARLMPPAGLVELAASDVKPPRVVGAASKMIASRTHSGIAKRPAGSSIGSAD